MASPLEDDADALAAVLELLEDDGLPTGDSLQTFSPLPQATWPPKAHDGAVQLVFSQPVFSQPVSPTAKNHRNGAREQRRRELKMLRSSAARLEKHLQTLRDAATQRAKRPCPAVAGGAIEPEQPSIKAFIWRDLAAGQLGQRLVAERENSRLKSALEDQRKLVQSLERVLRTRLAQRVMESCSIQDKRTRRVHAVPTDNIDGDTFHELVTGVDAVYHEAWVLLQPGAGAGGDAHRGAVAEKTLPFDVRATAAAAWRCLTHSLEHEKHRFSYQNDASPLSQACEGGDTVFESFGVELHAQQTTADFRIKQVFRRYVQGDRVVIAWRSFIDPAKFKGETLSGVRFQEKGAIAISAPVGLPPSNECSTLRTWHIITPARLPHPRDTEHQQGGVGSMRELTDFVLSGSSSGSAVQMIENLLLEQTRGRKPQ